MYRVALTLRTLFYFTMDGASSGFIAGGITGGLLIPLLGAMPGAFTGGFVGITIGFIVGLFVAVSDFGLINPETDVRTYRRKLAVSLGVIAGVLLGGLTLAWGISSIFDNWLYERDAFFIIQYIAITTAALLVFVIPAAVSIAASASYYADGLVAPFVTRKNDNLHAVRLPNNHRADRKFAAIMLRKSLWIIPISAVIGGCLDNYILSVRDSRAVNFGNFVEGTVIGGLAVIGVIVMLIILNTQVLRIANRLYFDEYGTHLTLAQYKYRLGILLGVTTLIYGLIITAVVFAPVAAIIAALSAREYADWHYGNEDKLKRDFAGKSKPFAADV